MTTQGSPFRTSVAACELCGSEVESSELTPVAHLSTCPTCRSKDLDAALRAHGFTAEHSQYETSSSESKERVTSVELRRPRELDLIVTFTAERWKDNWLERRSV